jgi:hypothetical protein
VILPIYLPPGADAPDGAVDLGASADPQRHRACVSLVLRRLDVANTVAAALLVLRRVGFTAAGDSTWRVRRNYEVHFGSDGEPVGETAERPRVAATARSMQRVCEPVSGTELALEDRVFVAACWLLWGDPIVGASWGVDAVARELAEECGVDVAPRYAVSAARSAFDEATARADAK